MSDLDEDRLGAWLADHLTGFAPPFTLAKFPGGQSNPTYRIDAASGRYVLRRKPFGPILPSAHAVEREHRLLRALHPAGFPVPEPLALCEDAAVIGAPFYLMAMVDGCTHWDGALPGMGPAARTAHYHAMIDTLAALHAIDPAQQGLGDYGRHGNYFERQVARWTGQYRASQTELLPEMERLIDWLPRTVPAQERTGIVHGDYRIDNLIFASGAPRVLAVIDWELSTLGDPLADFSYLLMNWVTEPEGRAGIKGLTGPDTGIPTLDEVVARYCAGTGRDGLPNLHWYFAYNLFRLAGIVQGIRKRMIDGNASSSQAADTVKRLPALVAAAWAFAKEAGA
jgi:aminoglycoside phosphotransferase (APT) family kinase protein